MPFQASSDHCDSADITEPTLAAEKIESTDATEPTDAIDSTEPAEPIDRMDPLDPMDKMDPLEPMDRIDPLEPMLSMDPALPSATLLVPHGVILAANPAIDTGAARGWSAWRSLQPRCTRCWPTGPRSRSARPSRPTSTRSRPCTRRCHSDNSYLRFFNVSRLSAEIEARRIARNPKPGSAALLAVANGEVVGVASYVPLREDPHTAEVAFAVADHMHHRGIATLLLEHLVSLARSRQITTFTAETLTENQAMLRVFADVGLPVRRRYREGVIELTFPLPGQDSPDSDTYLDAVAERERRADVASLRHIFAPESVAVIGASRRRGTVGRAILDNIRAAGYRGRLSVVNPRAAQVGGEPSLASPLDLPEPADLAVIAVPAARVLEVAAQCGQRGVRSLVVITSGLDPTQSAGLLAICRGHGMRLVGPDCFGVSMPGLGLDATFAARPARPGVAGLVMQSGGLGFALVDHLSRLGIGISSFASVGDKLDVSGNDMLLWWERDDQTRLAVLYLDSFGNPRKFARTARRVSCAMPVLTVPGRNNTLPGDAVRAGRRHHHRRLRRADRGGRAAGHPARPGRAHGGHRVQRPQRRPARRARRRPASACQCAARPKRPPRCRPKPSAKPWSSSPRTTRCTPSSRSCCPPAPPATWRRRSGRRPPENHSPPSC